MLERLKLIGPARELERACRHRMKLLGVNGLSVGLVRTRHFG